MKFAVLFVRKFENNMALLVQPTRTLHVPNLRGKLQMNQKTNTTRSLYKLVVSKFLEKKMQTCRLYQVQYQLVTKNSETVCSLLIFQMMIFESMNLIHMYSDDYGQHYKVDFSINWTVFIQGKKKLDSIKGLRSISRS